MNTLGKSLTTVRKPQIFHSELVKFEMWEKNPKDFSPPLQILERFTENWRFFTEEIFFSLFLVYKRGEKFLTRNIFYETNCKICVFSLRAREKLHEKRNVNLKFCRSRRCKFE